MKLHATDHPLQIHRARGVQKQGFTLIELSVVLVIIGLIVGGVMMGKDLISAAALRAGLSEMEKTNAAINTFKLKYGSLPGDLTAPQNYGLGISGGVGTGGDGNDAIYSYSLFSTGLWSPRHELLNVFHHLANAGMVAAGYTGVAASGGAIPTDLTGYVPKFKAASSPAFIVPLTAVDALTSANFGNSFTITSFSSPNATIATSSSFGLCLTGLEAYQVDAKIDDGLPRSGRVITMYPAVGPYWSGGGGQSCDYLSVYDILGARNNSGADSPRRPERIDCQLLIKAAW